MRTNSDEYWGGLPGYWVIDKPTPDPAPADLLAEWHEDDAEREVDRLEWYALEVAAETRRN